MKELKRSSLIILRKPVLTCRKAELAFFVSLSIRVFLNEYHDSQGSRGKGGGERGGGGARVGGATYLTLLYHFHLLHRPLDISQVIAAERSPLRIAGSQTQTRNLWFFLPEVAK